MQGRNHNLIEQNNLKPNPNSARNRAPIPMNINHQQTTTTVKTRNTTMQSRDYHQINTTYTSEANEIHLRNTYFGGYPAHSGKKCTNQHNTQQKGKNKETSIHTENKRRTSDTYIWKLRSNTNKKLWQNLPTIKLSDHGRTPPPSPKYHYFAQMANDVDAPSREIASDKYDSTLV